MAKNLKRGFLVLLTLQVVLYFLLGANQLEDILIKDFKLFNESRMANPYNQFVNEEYYVLGCGSALVKSPGKVESMLDGRYYTMFDSTRHYRNIKYKNDGTKYTSVLKNNTTKEEDVNCIFFESCRNNYFPALFENISITKGFSTHTDFHVMEYNKQLEMREVVFVWVLVRWVQIENGRLTF